MAAKISSEAFLSLIKNRRSYYPLSKTISPLTTTQVDSIVTEALQHVPSSFNSQSNRAIVLHGAHHEKLWSTTHDVLKAIVPADSFQPTSDKINMFKASAGTVLFFQDQDVINAMQEKFAVYADKFPTWAAQSDAMLQFSVWTALEAEGLGGNLQHYNPLIDEKVAAEWEVPASWKLSAQLVFGGKTGEAGEKAFEPVEKKFKSFN